MISSHIHDEFNTAHTWSSDYTLICVPEKATSIYNIHVIICKIHSITFSALLKSTREIHQKSHLSFDKYICQGQLTACQKYFTVLGSKTDNAQKCTGIMLSPCQAYLSAGPTKEEKEDVHFFWKQLFCLIPSLSSPSSSHKHSASLLYPSYHLERHG